MTDHPPFPCPAVVLLGAGASRDAGLPTAMELTEALRRDIDSTGQEDLRRALGVILAGLAFRNASFGLPVNGPVDIETVLRVAEQLANRMVHPLSWYVAAWHSAIEALAPGGNGVVFSRLINAARESLRRELRTPDPKRVKYLGGVRHLLNVFGVPPALFTLNYDRCVEVALAYEGMPFTTGFRDGLWTPEEFEAVRVTRVYKLHGSFGWVRHPQRGLVDVESPGLADNINIVSGDVADELIFGADNKLRAVQPFLWLIHQFSEAVNACRYIITIGYGWRDDHINQIIDQHMATDPTKRLIIVSPSAEEVAGQRTEGPHRVLALSHGAKYALDEEDSIKGELEKLIKTSEHEAPF